MLYQLIAEWALTTGMRRKELCGLSVAQVPETARLNADDHPLIGVASRSPKAIARALPILRSNYWIGHIDTSMRNASLWCVACEQNDRITERRRNCFSPGKAALSAKCNSRGYFQGHSVQQA